MGSKQHAGPPHDRGAIHPEQPFKGLRVSACLHVTSETANLMRALKAGGAEVCLCASNPLSTQDDVAASLVQAFGIAVFAIRGETRRLLPAHQRRPGFKPHLTMDDGADTIGSFTASARTWRNVILGRRKHHRVIRLRAWSGTASCSTPSSRSTTRTQAFLR